MNKLPNPQIEMRIRVQAIDVHSEFKKDNVTLLVMRSFLSLLGASRVCAVNVFSIWGFGKLYSILLISLLSVSNVYAEWQLKNIDSNVSYISTKNNGVSEINYFNTLNGTLSDDGELNIKINLESIETDVPIRNERVKSMLFEVLLYPKASITATISPEKLATLKAGNTYTETINFTLNLHGITQELSTTVKAIKHANGDILITPTTPILITAKQFGLEKGIERLRRIARLDSISLTVPVIFTLTFVPK